jgi:hypothetical protein
MRKTIATASFLVVGSGAVGTAAIVSPYQGSNTEFQVTVAAITAAGLAPASAYVGGASAAAAAAMTGSVSPYPAASAKQQTGPMDRMLANEAHVCSTNPNGSPPDFTSFNNGTNGSRDTSASGIVLGLDFVGIWSGDSAGGAPACNGTADNTGTGLAYSGTSSTIFSGGGTQNWKWILALLYGGKDYSNPGAPVDCGSNARKALVGNWSSLFQNGCANGVSQCISATGAVKGALWHAFRRDDASGTSEVFASILGLSPSPSASSLNGFGTSPYCNAMNWDTSTANARCALGANKQWVGPGGIFDPTAADGVHKRPPQNAWGDIPDPGQGALGADVLPTQFQDNDPIRRPCLGNGATGVHGRPGEEICNIDGNLGLVLPMPDSSWIAQVPSLVQYPTNSCNAWGFGPPVTVFTCAIRGSGSKHSGECPNGDSLLAGGCLVPIDPFTNTSQCAASKSNVTPFTMRTLPILPDGRIYNLHMRDGSAGTAIAYLRYQIPSLGISLDMAGGFSRIHEVQTIFGTTPIDVQACQLADMADQIGCLVQADPCSIGYAGSSAKTFAMRNPATAPGTAQPIDAVRVAQIAPLTAAVQALGTAGEYPLAQKLYFVSLPGFNHIEGTGGDHDALDELTLAQFAAIPANISPILAAKGFTTLGWQSPGGIDTQFCEDFNEQMVCNPTPGTPSTLPANVNGCAGNPMGLPTVSTTCGNGVREAFEECDNGLSNGTATDHCSQACRCVFDLNASGNCN